jgi:hypothetical protein
MIVMLLEPAAPLDYGLAGKLGQPAGDEPERLAAGVHFDRADYAIQFHD